LIVAKVVVAEEEEEKECKGRKGDNEGKATGD
jgi:hypothetical protein